MEAIMNKRQLLDIIIGEMTEMERATFSMHMNLDDYKLAAKMMAEMCKKHKRMRKRLGEFVQGNE